MTDTEKMKDWKVANLYGMPNLSVKLGDKTIEKYVRIRASVPEDGVPEDIADYNISIFVDGDIDQVRHNLSVLLAAKIADEINLFNDVIKEIDESLEPIRVSDLPLMLHGGGEDMSGEHISPNLKHMHVEKK